MLHHANIVPVYGVGCERGVHYYAMQFIDGRRWRQLIAENRSRQKKFEPQRHRGHREETRKQFRSLLCVLRASVVTSRPSSAASPS